MRHSGWRFQRCRASCGDGRRPSSAAMWKMALVWRIRQGPHGPPQQGRAEIRRKVEATASWTVDSHSPLARPPQRLRNPITATRDAETTRSAILTTPAKLQKPARYPPSKAAAWPLLLARDLVASLTMAQWVPPVKLPHQPPWPSPSP